MKTLFIGHYKEGSGWSHAAINSLLAANSVGIDIVARNIKLTNYQPKIDERIIALENKSVHDIDFCIQNVLPHHIVGTQKFKKNIAYFVGESNTLKYNHWLTNLQLVDEVWVPNESLRDSLLRDGLNKVKVVPYAFDLNKYSTTKNSVNFGPHNHKFKFYYIGDLNDRKNIESIIRCFHSEFHHFEPVSLVLKVKKFGINPKDLFQHVTNICSSIKKELRIYGDINQYHKELIICDDLTDDQILAIHNSCDCFVAPSHGEGWSIPAFDAMCFGKTPICSKEGGPQEFIDDNNKSTGWLVNGVYSICNHSDPAFPNLFTGREEWFTPSEQEIKKAMRFYYENKDSIDKQAGIKQAAEFSYEKVGQKIKDALND